MSDSLIIKLDNYFFNTGAPYGLLKGIADLLSNSGIFNWQYTYKALDQVEFIKENGELKLRFTIKIKKTDHNTVPQLINIDLTVPYESQSKSEISTPFSSRQTSRTGSPLSISGADSNQDYDPALEQTHTGSILRSRNNQVLNLNKSKSTNNWTTSTSRMHQVKDSPRLSPRNSYYDDNVEHLKKTNEAIKANSKSEFITPRGKSPLTGTPIKKGHTRQVQVQPNPQSTDNQSTDNQSTDNQSTVGRQGKFIANHQPITFLPDGPGYAPGKRIFHTRRSEKPPSTTGNSSKLSRVAMDNNNADLTTNNTDLGLNVTSALLNSRDAASTHNEQGKKVKEESKQRYSTRSKKVNPTGGKRKTRKNKKKKK